MTENNDDVVGKIPPKKLGIDNSGDPYGVDTFMHNSLASVSNLPDKPRFLANLIDFQPKPEKTYFANFTGAILSVSFSMGGICNLKLI